MLKENVPVWLIDHTLKLPRLEGDIEADVCVVGLGGSGLAAVHELLALGQDVVGIDAKGLATGAAGRNGGFLLAGTAAFYHDAVKVLGREHAKRLFELTAEQIEVMLAETPTAIRRTGSLRIAHDETEYKDCLLQFEAMQADGLEVSLYKGDEGKGLLFPRDASFNPFERCQLRARNAVAKGARLFEHSPALSVEPNLVKTAKASVRCKKVIVAVDGALERLIPGLQGRVRTARLQMLATEPLESVQVSRPVYRRYGYEYWQQLPDRRLALGGFRDKGGEDEWTFDTRPSANIQEELGEFLRQTLKIRAPITHRWAASVGFTKGILPIAEEVMQGVYAVGGYNGTGNVMGALCAKAAARAGVTGDKSLLKELASTT